VEEYDRQKIRTAMSCHLGVVMADEQNDCSHDPFIHRHPKLTKNGWCNPPFKTALENCLCRTTTHRHSSCNLSLEFLFLFVG